MIDFVGRRNWFFLASGVVLLIGVIFLLTFGLRGGIEFSSGSMMTISFEQSVEQVELREEMASLGHEDAIIQRTDLDVGGAQLEGFIIRTRLLSDEDRAVIEEALEERFGPLTVHGFDSVSPIIATEIGSYATIAVAVAAVGILLYITWAFRRLMRPFRFGVCAIATLVHDVLIVLGVFSILGVLFDMEINAMFITGVLTVIGYSVNNTIVVFDRIRENMTKSKGSPLETIVNNSIMETLGRSLNSSLTTLFVLLALLLLGGSTIFNFILVLLIGVIIGTYSSICIASQLLIAWDEGTFGRLFRRVIPRRVTVRGG